MSATDLRRIAAFRMSFARRQAAEATAIPGGAVVLDPEFAASYEHNQLVVEGPVAPPDLVALADAALGHLPHRQIAILDDALGVACAPALVAAGYTHHPELVMTHSGAAPAPGASAEAVTLAELRPALLGQQRSWMPEAEDEVLRQLTDRRAARLRGAEQVRFLAVRDEQGDVAAWADLYLDPAQDVAQIEEVVTVDDRTRRGYADTVLATALRQASGYGLFFLVAEPDDWPRHWYARRGFTAIGHSHRFSRT
ncbi:GNAT family N-acetyltransferase [Streptacidiphilus sp. P02-A3a]|uniref:GNAT family N-acetyltransferase n=1 Tax=Streptacidiphilus sp. P02-A3a TaxID=2704468 RepID=UPI0015F8E90D|nr:GNAT family N-acetyltransferase [Streptacidiphilus sp. P02-A3a]QMU67155.1 GNAT family N-acetyltransferase [Streptacidiphilus sp. P02-A3a]